MADESTHNSTMEEIEELFKDKEFLGSFLLERGTPAGNVSEESPLSVVTTPGPLNTAFINETDVDEQHSQHSLSHSTQSQTTREASSAIHGLIDTILGQEHEGIIGLHSPTKNKRSTGTMPRTPTMKSTGTMPRTPVMISTGTMPRTPVMVSTGTMPRTPTPAPLFASSSQTNEPCSSHPSTIDLVSPTIEIIDLTSPATPTNNNESPASTPYLPPQ